MAQDLFELRAMIVDGGKPILFFDQCSSKRLTSAYSKGGGSEILPQAVLYSLHQYVPRSTVQHVSAVTAE